MKWQAHAGTISSGFHCLLHSQMERKHGEYHHCSTFQSKLAMDPNGTFFFLRFSDGHAPVFLHQSPVEI